MFPISRASIRPRRRTRRKRHEAIRPTDFGKDKVGGGDHARLYDLIWKRALASQMASARLERTSVDLSDGTGKTMLRATGQVVKFPGFLALYDESRDDSADDEDARLLPAMAKGDTPAKTGVEVEAHETQPPPRYSEASLVKKMEELGIGRPSTYASILQVLKDRAYVRVEKNRFLPEESGRLLTAFLERFFGRYVEYDFTAGLEEELDDVSGGRAQWQAVLERFWRDFKPRTGEVMETEAVGDHRGTRRISWPLSLPRQGRRQRSARLPELRHRAACAARRKVRSVHCVQQLSRVQVHAQNSRAAGRQRRRRRRPRNARHRSRKRARGDEAQAAGSDRTFSLATARRRSGRRFRRIFRGRISTSTMRSGS